MAPKYWMITNREKRAKSLGRDRAKALSYWTTSSNNVDKLSSWSEVSADRFKRELVAVTGKFPLKSDEEHEKQKHLTLFIHGFNNDWGDAARMYRRISRKLFTGQKSLGVCVLFTWPSDGMKLGYYPDRHDAKATAPDLAHVFNALYDWMLVKQTEGIEDPQKACRAKVSVIAHSMGNFVLQNAMQYTWSRKNQPLLVSLVNQLVMVAADVDNDLFSGGEETDKSDGDAIANLTYRVTALYSRRDSVLGLSAGFKHFGKRRLGRSGLDKSEPVPDNVWDFDCTRLVKNKKVHSAYFEERKTLSVMRQVLCGVDRNEINVN